MRTRNSWITVLIAASAAMGWMSTAHSATTCAALYDKIRAAGDTVDPQTIKRFHQQAEKLADCDANFRLALGRRVAVSILTQVDEALKAGSSTATQKPALEESLKYHPMWVALAMLGDIASEGRDQLALASSLSCGPSPANMEQSIPVLRLTQAHCPMQTRT